MKRLMIFLIAMIAMMAIFSMSFAADVKPDSTLSKRLWGTRHYVWILATNQTVSGDSDKAINVGFCTGIKTLIFTTSGGSVDITFTIYSDGDNDDTLQMTSAGTDRISTWDSISEVYVNSAITAGQVDSIKQTCESQ